MALRRRERGMTGGAPQRRGHGGDWLRIEIFAPEALIDALTNFVTEIGAQGAYQEALEPPDGAPAPPAPEALQAFFPLDNHREARLAALQTYIESLADLFPGLAVPTFRTEIIRDPDWGEAWKRYFKPLRVSGGIVIKPTWEPFTPTGDDIVIEVDPGMAFGTGQHPSTRMCLEALEGILRRNPAAGEWRVLDLGTGTGILAIACAKLGAGRVLGVDNDPQATAIARENVLVNRVGDRVAIADDDIAALEGPFELIVANLTGGVLVDLQPHFPRLLRGGGRLVISGIIAQNQPAIEAAFLGGGLSLHRLLAEQEWRCYVLTRGEGRS